MNLGRRRQPGLAEDDLIAAIRKLLSADAPGVLVGPGDDAAVVELGRHPAVLTTDLLVEGVHFRMGAISAHDLGRKALTVNVSDVAAMGASPRYALVSFGLGSEAEAPFVMEVYGGLLEASEEYGLALVGGDLSRSDRVVLSVALVGEVAKGHAVTRDGAKSGDRIVVTGALGASAGGLRLAEARPGSVPDALGTDWSRALLEAHFRPVARVGEGQTLAQAGATAMMDVSDGLAIDLARLCGESGVGARIREEDLPLAPALYDLAKVAAVDPLELALHGGEDYELVATLPRGAVSAAIEKLDDRFGTALSDVGEVTDEGLVVVGTDGRERPLEPRGWDHFSA